MTISATTQGLRMGVATSSSRPTVPFDGQVISETDTDSLVVYKGSAWAPVSGLTFISATTIGTTVSSVTVSSAFSTTYDNYKVIIQGGESSAYCFLRLTLGATATGYYAGVWDFNYAGATGATGQANTAFWLFGIGTTSGLSASGEILHPFLGDQTTFNSSAPSLLTTDTMRQAGGMLNNTTSYTAFTITPSTGTLTGGTVRVYGYSNS